MTRDLRNIRNFSIIAHIDHGKSTLADRLLEATQTIPPAQMMDQVLDDMDIERERGITIKSHPVALRYVAVDKDEYRLNLIDTPGHVDFTYEVSRSLAACEGAVLVVDATQGVEAQTMSNFYLALQNDLTIIPVVNKIDLPAARTEEVARELAELVGEKPDRVIRVSAKLGVGIEALLEAIVERVPPPLDKSADPFRALIFDSEFNQFRGVIPTLRVVDGEVRPGTRVRFHAAGQAGQVYEVVEVGTFRLGLIPAPLLRSGEVGYIVAGVKDVAEVQVGDTVLDADRPAAEPLPGYQPMKPMVFSGLYPVDTEDYGGLRDALAKLRLNDASLSYEPETSVALGFGFRCGFLGLLHLEIVRERLTREYGLNLISTVPSVAYQVWLESGEVVTVDNPARMPPAVEVAEIEEPMVRATIVSPPEYVGNLMKLCQDRRGSLGGLEYPAPNRAVIHYELPFAEVVLDFYDRLKSVSKGYASFDYEPSGTKASRVVKMDILLNGDPVDALSAIIHADKAYEWGKEICERLKGLIPRQLFQVAIQAAIGSRVVARETISALRKNVTAKCYGGDITRKRKLLERQKEGKKRMKQIGSVEVPQEAFLAVLKVGK
jgi:GTP-binding protein LepA